ncbi:MAG: nitroreductase family deazaflavin-dependent oxidoreductase [Chloroflexi bacterium]|nr:MAG: nitroreductase family deazaflavin-dependent oxidoreductase [Chloroflexota bacterium]MBL1193994.1 nitroreductase family deazaflavin-dependent oxidoreductase [Chloroflexota bacterium]NOH11288.1 nitroreductase family deazaflavin-dependent oxidoreductase [Chloroflexota bacterium]
MTNESGSGPRVSWFAKLAFRIQAFLLKRGWMGPAGNFLMAITTTGRKSGKQFTVPIGYLNDGDAVIAMNPTGNSNWMKNVQANGDVLLHIKGQSISMQGRLVSDPVEKRRIFDIYKQTPDTFPRYFGVTVDAPEGELNAALDKAHFVRFE